MFVDDAEKPNELFVDLVPRVGWPKFMRTVT